MDIELAKKIRNPLTEAETEAQTVSHSLEFCFQLPDRAGTLRTLVTINTPMPVYVPRVGETVTLNGFDLKCMAVETEYRILQGTLHLTTTVTVDEF
ncbi:hypothetical protein [Streptomyces sp. G1]|uniref:hypothetical protein n=1 Tax=Streptomyces sp. G1 TaxID=361572 RepID=UPI00202E1348|nr:hypothetical protein [Streptomyces sp. G1]MCM1964873.1 hypothetical protein [Streptomyces sp. G1]